MTTHPPEPPAEWESYQPGRPARDGELARPADEWPGPAGPPHTGDRIASSRLAAAHPATGYHAGDYDDGYPAGDYLPDHPSMPGFPAMPDYPPLSDHPSMPGCPPLSDHPSLPGYPAGPDYPPLSDHPSMPGYPPLSDHPSMPGFLRAPDYWPGPGHPADSHVDHDEYLPAPSVPGPSHAQQGPPVLAPPGLAEAPARPAGPERRARPHARPTASEDAHWAMLAYLTVPIFGCIVSLAIYLLSLRGSRWLRAHAAQALNVWLTWLLYNVSAVIVGGLLALDSAHVALTVVLPAAVTLWLIILAYLIRAARLASQGREYALPRWLCSPLIR
jgi:uncharacterized Tic20 family protein